NPEVYAMTGQPSQTCVTVNPPFVQNNFVVNSTQMVNPILFLYRPPNDFCEYLIKLYEIPTNMAVQILNDLYSNNININYSEYIFFFQHQINNRIYQVICEPVPLEQKENLRYYLALWSGAKRFAPQKLVNKKIFY